MPSSPPSPRRPASMCSCATDLSPQIANQLLEEGALSPADVFYSEGSPPVAALAKHGMLSPIGSRHARAGAQRLCVARRALAGGERLRPRRPLQPRPGEGGRPPLLPARICWRRNGATGSATPWSATPSRSRSSRYCGRRAPRRGARLAARHEAGRPRLQQQHRRHGSRGARRRSRRRSSTTITGFTSPARSASAKMRSSPHYIRHR